jgi:hypothetical protein
MHVAALEAFTGFAEPRPAYLRAMQMVLLMGNWGEGLAMLLIGAFLLTLVSLIVLIGFISSQRIGWQLDREWTEQKEKAASRARWRHWIMLLTWLLLSIVFWKAFLAWLGL